jgi:hypothetical protein
VSRKEQEAPAAPLPENALDLEEYRRQRTEDGTWPPSSKEEHEEFFRRWKDGKKK